MSGLQKIVLLLIALLSGPWAYGSPDHPQGQTWEFFAARFRPDMPPNVLTETQNEQAAAYARHLAEPHKPEHLIAVARYHFRLRAYPEAAQWYLKVLRLDPENRDAPTYFAECLYHTGHPDLARNLFEQFEHHQQAIPITSIMLAEIYYRKKDFAKARPLLERVLTEAKSHEDNPVYAMLREHVTHNLKILQEEK